MGTFSALASYAIDNTVTWNGSTYVSIAASQGPNNPTPNLNSAAWSLIASAGAAGPAGTAGPTGPAGATGPAGQTGPAGPQGLTGSTGPAGATGAIGPAGPIGATGPQGPQGPQGPIGPGVGFTYMGAFSPSATYAINDAVTYNGSSYVSIAASQGPNNPTPNLNSAAWSLIASAGAAGPTGAAGPAGATGATGPAGPMGPAGPQGPQGPAGYGATPVDLGTLAYSAGGTTTFAAGSAPLAGARVTATHATSTIFSPTGLVMWGQYVVIITQDSVGGGVTFSLGTSGSCTAWKITGGGSGALVLSTVPNAQDELSLHLRRRQLPRDFC